MRMVRVVGGLIIAGTVALATGCGVTSEQIEELRALAQQAQQTADGAQSAAAAAQSAADSANSKADSALSAANDANNCCRRNSEKMDRMFEKAMQK